MIPEIILSDIRKYDYDRYICGIFADENARENLFALYAFNLEIAKIGEAVSEPMPGLLRLEWWRGAMRDLFHGGKIRNHEILEKIAEMNKETPLSEELFSKILEARVRDINNIQPENMAELLQYAEDTSSGLLLLALQTLGIRNSDASVAARHIGIAWALIGILRSAYINIPRSKFHFPLDMMNENKITRDNYGSEKFLNGSKIVVKNIAEIAEKNIFEADLIIKKLDKNVRKKSAPVFLLKKLSELHLKKIRKNDFDVFTRRIEISPPRKLITIKFF